MVRRLWVITSLVALLCGALFLSGCVSSSADEAQTPESAQTAANSALQTDENGSTVAPEGTEPPPAEEPTEPGEPIEVEGDAAAGEAVFTGVGGCQGCHMNGGNDAGGVGPQLAGQGLDPAGVENVIVNGQGAMPAGLVSGDDLTNVVAYVISLQ